MAEITDIKKTQSIRLADVTLIGPAMFVGGRKLVRSDPMLGYGLMLAGAGTVIYNGHNYLRVLRGAESEGPGLKDQLASDPYLPQLIKHILPAVITAGVMRALFD